MTDYEVASVVIAGIAALISGIALYFSRKAASLAQEANQLSGQANTMASDANKLAGAANHLAGEANVLANGANQLANRANDLNLNIAKRQGVFDLFLVWQNVNEIDRNKLIGPDIVKAANALGLTAMLWNHDVVEKKILYQSYWQAYRTLFDQLYYNESLVPGLKRTLKSMVSPEMQKVYDEMKSFDLARVVQTGL